jgi:hypothetical protein
MGRMIEQGADSNRDDEGGQAAFLRCAASSLPPHSQDTARSTCV